MIEKLSQKAKAKRYQYNVEYQKQYVNRYVFKLNTRKDKELIRTLEKMDNRTAWFKKALQEECDRQKKEKTKKKAKKKSA